MVVDGRDRLAHDLVVVFEAIRQLREIREHMHAAVVVLEKVAQSSNPLPRAFISSTDFRRLGSFERDNTSHMRSADTLTLLRILPTSCRTSLATSAGPAVSNAVVAPEQTAPCSPPDTSACAG